MWYPILPNKLLNNIKHLTFATPNKAAQMNCFSVIFLLYIFYYQMMFILAKVFNNFQPRVSPSEVR